MSELLSVPPVPPECDLRGLTWMPIDTVRLLDSDLFAVATGEEFKAAVALWCKAWHQVPAGSLPDDDRVLAHLSGVGAARWRKIKEQVLHGFVKCADGRLYHPVIAEKVLEAWERREVFYASSNNKSERQKRWRNRHKDLSAKLRALGITPQSGASLQQLERLLVDAEQSTRPSTGASTVDARETPLKETGQGNDMTRGSAPISTAVAYVESFANRPKGGLPPGEVESNTEPSTRARIADALKKLGVTITSLHPLAVKWAEGSVGIDMLTAAVDVARQRKGPAASIPAAYLAPIVEDMLNGKGSSQAHSSQPFDPDRWWKSDNGIKAEGAKHGLFYQFQEPGDFIYFKARVLVAAGDGPWIDERDVTTFRLVNEFRARASDAAHAESRESERVGSDMPLKVFSESEAGDRSWLTEYPAGDLEEVARKVLEEYGSLPSMNGARSVIVRANGTESRFSVEDLRSAH